MLLFKSVLLLIKVAFSLCGVVSTCFSDKSREDEVNRKYNTIVIIVINFSPLHWYDNVVKVLS